MIQIPTPMQHALVAQMLQRALPPGMSQQGGTILPSQPDPNAQGDWSYGQQFVHLPDVFTSRPAHLNGAAVDESQYVPQGHPAFADQLTGHGPPVDPGFNITPATSPHTVFHAMRKALPAATRSAQTSHRDALVQRFMQNIGGVRK